MLGVVFLMEVFQTNAGLGYRQLAYLVKLDKSKNGNNYLCIGKNFNGESYEVGNIVMDLEDFYLEPTTFKIEDSELSGTYLFEFWKHNYRVS